MYYCIYMYYTEQVNPWRQKEDQWFQCFQEVGDKGNGEQLLILVINFFLLIKSLNTFCIFIALDSKLIQRGDCLVHPFMIQYLVQLLENRYLIFLELKFIRNLLSCFPSLQYLTLLSILSLLDFYGITTCSTLFIFPFSWTKP